MVRHTPGLWQVPTPQKPGQSRTWHSPQWARPLQLEASWRKGSNLGIQNDSKGKSLDFLDFARLKPLNLSRNMTCKNHAGVTCLQARLVKIEVWLAVKLPLNELYGGKCPLPPFFVALISPQVVDQITAVQPAWVPHGVCRCMCWPPPVEARRGGGIVAWPRRDS